MRHEKGAGRILGDGFRWMWLVGWLVGFKNGGRRCITALDVGLIDAFGMMTIFFEMRVMLSLGSVMYFLVRCWSEVCGTMGC
jgi:hypothetical protein